MSAVRVLLFTGKGGVGKTTVAAATAVRSASSGHKTLVLSTDAAHSLADVFSVALAGEPLEIEPGLFASHVDTAGRFERSWHEVSNYLLSVLDAAGVDPIEAAELTVLPGAEEILALLEVRDQVASGRWDVVVVDCAPTAETLRLLALPEALNWYMERVFPVERRVVRSLRPVLGRVVGVPMPKDHVFDAIERLHGELADVRALLTDSASSVRLVLTPEAMVVAEARRTLTSLSLHGYRVDAVVANRVFPAGGADPWRSAWVQTQTIALTDVCDSFAPLPVRTCEFRSGEPLGVQALADLADGIYGADDAIACCQIEAPVMVDRSGAEFVLSVSLPFADRDDMDLMRKGDELVLTVGTARRVLALPSALRRCTVAGAALRDGRLRIRFEPDPSLWRGL